MTMLSWGTIGKSSEITISLSFNASVDGIGVNASVDAGGVTAEYAEYAEVSENPARIGTVLKLCVLPSALRASALLRRSQTAVINHWIFRQCR